MFIILAKHPRIEPKRIRIRDVMAITVHYAEGSGIGYNAQGYEIAKTREGLHQGKLWHYIVADNLDNRLKGYVECVGEPRNQLFEFRVSGTERQDTRIITRGKSNYFAFNRFFGREIGQYRRWAPSAIQIPTLPYSSKLTSSARRFAGVIS
jgi:hypothetical protein